MTNYSSSECIYPRYASQIQQRIKIFPQFRTRLNDHARLNAILDKFRWLLEKEVILIKPNLDKDDF